MNMMGMIKCTEASFPGQVIFRFLFNIDTFRSLYHDVCHLKYLTIEGSPVLTLKTNQISDEREMENLSLASIMWLHSLHVSLRGTHLETWRLRLESC